MYLVYGTGNIIFPKEKPKTVGVVCVLIKRKGKFEKGTIRAVNPNKGTQLAISHAREYLSHAN